MIRRMLNTEIGLGWLVFLGTIAVIGSVLAFEHIGGYIPCALCLKQREPYYAAIPVALLALSAAYWQWPRCLRRGTFAIAGLLILYSLALAAYHSGVEWAWWAGTAECGATGASEGAAVSADNLLGQLGGSKPPSCNEAAGRFLGLSFAGWNVVVSAVLAYLAFRAATRDLDQN